MRTEGKAEPVPGASRLGPALVAVLGLCILTGPICFALSARGPTIPLSLLISGPHHAIGNFLIVIGLHGALRPGFKHTKRTMGNCLCVVLAMSVLTMLGSHIIEIVE